MIDIEEWHHTYSMLLDDVEQTVSEGGTPYETASRALRDHVSALTQSLSTMYCPKCGSCGYIGCCGFRCAYQEEHQAAYADMQEYVERIEREGKELVAELDAVLWRIAPNGLAASDCVIVGRVADLLGGRIQLTREVV